MIYLDHIDKIARNLQRDVLYFTFHNTELNIMFQNYSYELDKNRDKIVKWLNENSIRWTMCAEMANEDFINFQYFGQIFIDVEINAEDVQFKKILEHFELNNKMKDEFFPAKLWILSLDLAMENSHHDKPGFWEEWAETF